MELTSVFSSFFTWIFSAYTTLRENTVFTAYGYTSSYLDIVLAFIIVSMVVSIFWKGARG